MTDVVQRSILDIGEPLEVPASARINGAFINLSTYSAWMAFLGDGINPQNTDWVSGYWDVDVSATSVPVYKLRAIPPTLSAGVYKVWAKLSGGGFTKIAIVGTLKMT